MTVSSATYRNDYSGNGITTVFAYTFKIQDQAHVEVILVSSAGVETTQTLTTNYSVSGVGAAGGGNITMVTAPASGESLVIRRKQPFIQETDYVSGDPFPAETHEAALDELTLNDLNIKEVLDRCVQAPDQDSSIGKLPNVTNRKNKILTFDSNGDPETSVLTADIANLINNLLVGTEISGYSTVLESHLGSEADGSNKFTLSQSYTPGNNNLFVFRNGQLLRKGSSYDYTETSSTEVTLTYNPNDNDQFLFVIGVLSAAGSIDSANVTYTPAGTGAVATNVQAKLREYVSVTDFGAVGDGVTDDTAAIQAAHDYCVSTGTYKGVHFPAGVYVQSAQINWSPFVKAQSLGYVIFKCTQTSGFAWNISTEHGPKSGITGTGEKAFQRIFDGNFEFNASSAATNTTVCFLIGSPDTATWSQATSMLSIEGLSTNNFQGAVEMGDHAYLTYFRNCHFLGSYDPTRVGNTYGLYSRARNLTDSGTSLVFMNCLFAHLGAAFYTPYTLGRFYVYLETCELGANIQLIKQTPVRATGGEVFTFTDCYFEHTWNTGSVALDLQDNEVYIKGGNLYGGNYTYDSPLLADVNTSAKLAIQGLQISLDNALADLITGDSTANVTVDGLKFRKGTTTPTNIVNLTSGATNEYEHHSNLKSRQLEVTGYDPTLKWGLDFATGTGVDHNVTIADTATLDLANGGGIVILNSNTDGKAAIFLCYGGSVVKIGGDASYVATTPASTELGLYYSGVSARYRIENKRGAAQDLYIVTIRTRQTA